MANQLRRDERTPSSVGALPPGVQAPKTDAGQRKLYRAALDFEGVFTQHLVDDMMKSARSGDEDQSRRHVGIYNDMINQQLNDVARERRRARPRRLALRHR